MEEYGPEKIKIEFEKNRDCFNCDHELFCFVCKRFCTLDNMLREEQARTQLMLSAFNESPLKGNPNARVSLLIANMCCKFEPKKDKNAL